MPAELFIEDEKNESSHRSRRHRDPQEKFEEEVKAFSTDDTKMAREIISLKKEVNRLHFKVKTYQEKNRNFQIISTVIIVIMLSVLLYGVFTNH